VEAYFEIAVKQDNPYGIPVQKDVLGRVTLEKPAMEQPSQTGNV
jgi:hypothetical protein